MALHSMPLSVVAALLAAAPRALCESALPCSTRVLPAVAEGAGQPAISGFKVHCSVQVSKVRAPPEGFIAWAKSCQANCASLSGLPAATLGGAASFWAGGSAAAAAEETMERRTALNQARFSMMAPL